MTPAARCHTLDEHFAGGHVKAKPKKKKAVRAKARTSAAKKARSQRLDRLLDSELEDTFPASDPIELTEPGRHARRKNARGKA
jgi:hypothetical protein